jgi:hypothetical protein
MNLTWQALTDVNLTGQAPVRSAGPTPVPSSGATGRAGQAGPRLRDLHAAPTGGVNMAQRAKSEEKWLMAYIDNPITATAF